jgi:hypothetical protein
MDVISAVLSLGTLEKYMFVSVWPLLSHIPNCLLLDTETAHNRFNRVN